jgi:hypothetical protein
MSRDHIHERSLAGTSMSVAVGEMRVGFIRDAGSNGRASAPGSAQPRAQVSDGNGAGQGGDYDEPIFWWKNPFVYLYVISPTGPHDHKV